MKVYGQIADKSDGHSQVFGEGTTAMIIDDSEGGVIAYAHIGTVVALVEAINVGSDER